MAFSYILALAKDIQPIQPWDEEGTREGFLSLSR